MALLCVLARLLVDIGQPLFADDIWWHVALGRNFTTFGGFPATEPLLFTSAGHPQFYHEWLFQLCVAAIDAAGGMALLRAMQVALVMLLLQQIYLFARIQGLARTLALAVALAAIFFAFQRLMQFRPHLFSMVFFYAALNVYCVPVLNWRRVALLCVVVVLWANSHSTVMLLFPFLAVYLLLDGGHLGLRSRTHALGFLAALATVAINPQGLRLYVFYFIHDQNNALVRIVDEWGKITAIPTGVDNILPWSSSLLLCGFAAAVIATLAIAISYMRRGLAFHRLDERDLHLFIWAVMALVASAIAARFLWLMPLVLLMLVRVSVPAAWSRNTRVLFVLASSLLVFVHQTSAGTVGYRYQLSADTGAASEVALSPGRLSPTWLNRAIANSGYIRAVLAWFEPHGLQGKFQPLAMRSIANSGYRGQLFTPYHLGGFASYVLPKGVKVFYNGRYDGYSKQVYDDSFRLYRGGADTADVIARYDIDGFLLLLSRDSYKLVYTLGQLGWCEGYHDSAAIWLVAPELLAATDSSACPPLGGPASVPAEVAREQSQAAIVEAVRHHRLSETLGLVNQHAAADLPQDLRAALGELCTVHRELSGEVNREMSSDAQLLCGRFPPFE